MQLQPVLQSFSEVMGIGGFGGGVVLIAYRVQSMGGGVGEAYLQEAYLS